MKLRKGDRVKVTTGKYKGTIGSILRIFKARNSVEVEGVNVKKRALDKRKFSESSQSENFIYIQHPINVSNVRLVDDEGKYVKKRSEYVKKVSPKSSVKSKKKKSEKTEKPKRKAK